MAIPGRKACEKIPKLERKKKNKLYLETVLGSDWPEHRMYLRSGKKYGSRDNHGPDYEALHA